MLEVAPLNLILTFCVGAVMVGVYSWSRFDEPSYPSQTEYFARYKPRFSTSHGRYVRAKWGYIFVIILVYTIVSLIPGVAIEPKNQNGLSSPLVVALGIVTLQNVPMLKDLERRIRGFLHAFAQIPEGVRRTVAQMRSSEFRFDPAAFALQMRRMEAQALSGTLESGVLNNVVMDDEILQTWYCMGCVLFSLSEHNRNKIGIDPIFFEYYKDDFESIDAKHGLIAEAMRQRLGAFYQNPSSLHSSSADKDDTAVVRELHDLRERLYTFVACGVCSSVKTDVESAAVLTRLGFISDYRRESDNIIGPIAGFSVIAVMIVSIFTGFSTQFFRHIVLAPLPYNWNQSNVFLVPKDITSMYTWSLFTAAYYVAAIIGALTVRNKRLSRHEWFDINDLERNRPILNYVTPVIVGTAVGGVTLFLIALTGGPGFHFAFGELSSALNAAWLSSLPWFPLAIVMALIALWLSDTAMSNDQRRWPKFFVRGIVCGLLMALIGYLTSYISISLNVESFAVEHALIVPGDVNRAVTYACLFLAGQIGLFVFILCSIVQFAVFYTENARRLAGKCMQAISQQGAIFALLLDPTSRASLFAAHEKDFSPAKALCHGQWTLFPEGTALRWTDKPGERHSCGDFGLISWSGGYPIYEGYNGRISGVAEFVAQLRPVREYTA